MQLGFLTPTMEAVGEVAGAPSTPLPEGRARARDGAAPVTGAQRSIRGPRHGAHGPQERCSGSDCQTWSRKHRLWGQRLPSPATGMRNQCPSWFIYKDSPSLLFWFALLPQDLSMRHLVSLGFFTMKPSSESHCRNINCNDMEERFR